jgi:hypothetical protein
MKEQFERNGGHDRDRRPTTTLHQVTTPRSGRRCPRALPRPSAGLAGEPYGRNVILLTHPPPSVPADGRMGPPGAPFVLSGPHGVAGTAGCSPEPTPMPTPEGESRDRPCRKGKTSVNTSRTAKPPTRAVHHSSDGESPKHADGALTVATKPNHSARRTATGLWPTRRVVR